MELNKKNMIKVVMLAGIISSFYWGLQNLSQVSVWVNNILGILSPAIIGISIAFIVNIPMRSIEKNVFGGNAWRTLDKIKRPLSLLLAISLVIAIIMVLLFIVIPELAITIDIISQSVPGFIKNLQTWSTEAMGYFPEWGTTALNDIDFMSIGEKILTILRDGLTGVLNSTFTVASSVLNGLINFAVGFVLSIYILIQKETLSQQFKKIIYAILPEQKADKCLYILKLTNVAFSNFFTGQCLEAVIIGAMFFVAMSLFKFPYALMISVIIMFTALIPVFGAFLGGMISVFFIVVIAPMKAVWFLVHFLIIQQIEGNLIYPRVVGNSVGLPGIWVLLAVTLGGGLMGVVGMLVMVPICSVAYTLTREFVDRRIKDKKVDRKKFIYTK